MFCIHCGKEIEEDTKWCPYCGEKCADSAEHKQEMDNIRNNYNGKINNKKKKRKKPIFKRWWFWTVISLTSLLIIVLAFGSSDNGYSYEEKKTAPVSWSDVGGFTGWKDSGFDKSVRTDIKVAVPVVERSVNNYAVNIGPLGLDSVLIMQENEAPAKEWDWLMDAKAFEEDGDFAYFEATLTYTGITTDDEYQLPVFWISDIKPYQNTLVSEVESDTLDDQGNVQVYTDNSSGMLPVYVLPGQIQEISDFSNVSITINSAIDVDIKEGAFGIMAWDEYGLPLTLDDGYFPKLRFENLAANKTKEIAFNLMTTGVKYLQVILLSYEDYEGSIWSNPAEDYMKNNWAGKKYDATSMSVFEYDYSENIIEEEAIDVPETIENQESLEPERFNFIGVDGIYCDYSNGSDYSDLEVRISNITQSSFDFAIYEYNELIFKHHTAEITSETSGTYYGQQYTLYFTWTDVGTLEINGFEAVEGVSFVNSSYYQVS